LVGRWFPEDGLHSILLGVDLHPGSINLFVVAPEGSALACSYPFFRAEEDESVEPRVVRQRGVLRFRRCSLNDRHEAFILRTEYPAKEYDGPGRLKKIWHGHTMFEIVGPRIPELRGYGEEMTLSFDAERALEVIDVR